MTLLPAVAPVISGLSILDFITTSPLSLERIFVFSMGFALKISSFNSKHISFAFAVVLAP